MSADRQDPTAGPTDVAQQQLQHTERADVLHPFGVHGQTDRIADIGGALTAAGFGECFRDAPELFDRHTADVCDHLGCVPGVVPFQEGQHAHRVGHRRIGADRAGLARFSLVLPGGGVVFAQVRVPTAEQAVEVVG